MTSRQNATFGGQDRVCLGQISGAHGVRGLVKVRSFTEAPDGLTAYGPLTDAGGGRTFTLTLLSQQKGHWLARIDGVADRTAAEALSGTGLFVARDRLPPTDDEEFYHTDLIGMRAEGPEGQFVGRVKAIHDFGAGDVLELALSDMEGAQPTLMLPFTRAVVPNIDLGAGRLVVIMPTDDSPEPAPVTALTAVATGPGQGDAPRNGGTGGR